MPGDAAPPALPSATVAPLGQAAPRIAPASSGTVARGNVPQSARMMLGATIMLFTSMGVHTGLVASQCKDWEHEETESELGIVFG